MVIDTHVLYWWLDGLPRLSKKAEAAFRAAPGATAPIRIAAVSFWELADKEHRRQFAARRPVRDWPALIAQAPWLDIVDTDVTLWLAAADLHWSHRDPADRIIAATALAHGVPVLTNDHVFHTKDCPVEAVW